MQTTETIAHFATPPNFAGVLFIFIIRKTKMRMSTSKPTSYGTNYFFTFVTVAKDISCGNHKIKSSTRREKKKER